MNTSAKATPGLTAEQARSVRGYMQGLYNGGLVACLIGVLGMAAGRSPRFSAAWLSSVGVAVMVLGLGLLAYAMMRRLAYARSLAAGNDG